MRDSFGILQFSGKPGEKRKRRKASRNGLEARRWESVCFPLVSRGMLTEEGEAHMDMMSLMSVDTLVFAG